MISKQIIEWIIGACFLWCDCYMWGQIYYFFQMCMFGCVHRRPIDALIHSESDLKLYAASIITILAITFTLKDKGTMCITAVTLSTHVNIHRSVSAWVPFSTFVNFIDNPISGATRLLSGTLFNDYVYVYVYLWYIECLYAPHSLHPKCSLLDSAQRGKVAVMSQCISLRLVFFCRDF